MAKKIIRLTESDLRNILKNSVKKIIKEASYDDFNKEWNKGKIKNLYNFMRSNKHDGPIENDSEATEWLSPSDENYGVSQSYNWKDDDNFAGNINNFISGEAWDGETEEPIDDDEIEINRGEYTANPSHTSYTWNGSSKMDDLSGDELSDFYDRFSKNAKKDTIDVMYDEYGNNNIYDRKMSESYIRKIVNESIKKVLKEDKPDPTAKPWELFKQSKYFKGRPEPETPVSNRPTKIKNFGDWRDSYDEYMDAPNLSIDDPEKGTQLGNKYRLELKKAFNGDTEAMQKALNRHINYREMLRRERLQQIPGGLEMLDNDDDYDVYDDDEIDNNSAMTADDLEQKLRDMQAKGYLK